MFILVKNELKCSQCNISRYICPNAGIDLSIGFRLTEPGGPANLGVD